jgi:branched-subunit amino acid transport protein
MIWIVLGMMVVTYAPRLLPFYVLDFNRLPAPVVRALRRIPAAALGALLVPGVYDAVPGSHLASLAGAGAALVIACLTRNVLYTLIAAAGVAIATLALGG